MEKQVITIKLEVAAEVAVESIRRTRRDWNTVTVGELLQILAASKGKIHSYNGLTRTLERLLRAIDEAAV